MPEKHDRAGSEESAGGLDRALGEASAALAGFASGPVQEAADALEQAFGRAGQAIARDLGQAALRGEVDMRRMVRTVLGELAKIALDRLLPATGRGLFGARAGGGPVVPGGGYLVGEQGPELFFPASAGRIASGARQSGGGQGIAITVNVAAGADAASILAAEGQIAAALARAVQAGGRYL